MHTYRGRQGADVALLIRRVRDACEGRNVQCVGTSATMATEGTSQQRRKVVADVAFQLFGTPVAEENVIGETLIRATAEDAGPVTPARIAAPAAPAGYADLVRDPLASLGRDQRSASTGDEEGRLARRADHGPAGGAATWRPRPARTGTSARRRSSAPCKPVRGPRTRSTGRPLFAFRLHQFLSKGDTVYVTLGGENTPAHHPRLPGRAARLGRQGAAAAGVLPRVRPGVPGRLAAGPGRHSSYLARRDATVARRRRATPTATSTSPATCRGRATLETVVADRRVPESWLEVNDRTGQDVVRPTARKYLPVPVTVDAFGRERPAEGGIEAAFIPGPFRFCLRCGVSYEQVSAARTSPSWPPSTRRAGRRPRR